MIRAFLDASVLFAASYSQTGASREIIRRAIRGEIRLVASELVLEEARRNLRTKAPRAAAALEIFLAAVEFEIVRPTTADVRLAMQYTVAKDAPIVAAAIVAEVDCLLSLDRRHLVGAKSVAKRSGLRVTLPSEYLAELRSREQ